MRRTFAALCLLMSESAWAGPHEIRLSAGWIRGIEEEGGVVSYRGIPYAKPPRGDLRWQPPAAPEPWTGIRDGSLYGKWCPQPSFFGKPTPSESSFDFGAEDCLNLNVWVPRGASSAAVPVMVFIHGGGFGSGSGVGITTSDHLYSGEKLSAHGDVIVVSLNYRLGALGFLAEPALSATSATGTSGNFGLLDQIAALQWVQREIGAFGGDPQNVTVFGESSGAMSICALVAQTKHQGLFLRAIMQSGACQARERVRQEARGTELAATLGCSQTSLEERAACLRRVPLDQIVKKQPAFSIMPYGRNPAQGLAFAPVVDGGLLPDFPLKIIERGEHQKVPMIVGTNEEELPSVLFSTILTGNQFTKMLARAGFPETDQIRLTGVYGKGRFGSYPAATAALGTDIQFNCPSRAVVRALVTHDPGRTYSYNFGKPAVELSDRFIGTFHGVDMLYVFQKLSVGEVTMAADSPNRRLAAMIGDYWTNFAKTGVPSAASGLAWEPFQLDNPRQIRLDREISEIPAQRDHDCDLINKLSVGVDR